MRDYNKLKAYRLAHELAIQVYRATSSFPREERYGLTAQMRRCAVSVPSNIVEGCARRTTADYVHFLDNAYGSVCELEYQLMLADELGYMRFVGTGDVRGKCSEVSKVLNGLIGSLRRGARIGSKIC